MTNAPAQQKQPKTGWLNLAVDYGPIVAFFIVYRHYAPADKTHSLMEVAAVIRGTLAFMATAVVALGVSKWKLGRISPMLWLSTALIVFFGALTILLQDKFYIQIKPTVIYLIFGLSLLIGIWRGRPLLKYLLEAAFEGLNDRGWMLLSRNWGVFFLCLAALNEALRMYLSFGDWLQAKLWLFMPLSFIFTFAHMPMLLRNGLAAGGQDDVVGNPPHE